GSGDVNQHNKIGGHHEHAGERKAVPFPSGKNADRLEHVVLGEQKAAQDTAQFGIGGARRDGSQVVDQASGRVQFFVLVLREIIGLRIVPQSVLPGGDWLGSGQNLDESGFAGAVYAHQRYPVAALDEEIGVAENQVVA